MENNVYGVLSIPENVSTIVILSHGYGSSKDSRIYKELQDEFNLRGIGTLRYDYYGHGTGNGASKDVTLSKTVESLKAVIRFVKEKEEYDIALLGSSFGGLISIIAASQDPSIKALALKSPVTEPIKFWRDRLGNERRQWKKDRILHYKYGHEDFPLEYGFWEDLQTYDTLDSAKNISCPVFIVHGERDSYVPINQSYALAEILDTEVKVIKGAEHGYSEPNQYEEVKRLMIEFLVEKLK